MSAEVKINDMGSEVREGYQCKPVVKDPNKPIMHYRYHLMVCDGERCAQAFGQETGGPDSSGSDIAERLRAWLKERGLNKGAQRIKVTRTLCQGACRFRGVLNLYGLAPNEPNHGLWLKQAHTWDRARWDALFDALCADEDVRGAFADALIPMKVYE